MAIVPKETMMVPFDELDRSVSSSAGSDLVGIVVSQGTRIMEDMTVEVHNPGGSHL